MPAPIKFRLAEFRNGDRSGTAPRGPVTPATRAAVCVAFLAATVTPVIAQHQLPVFSQAPPQLGVANYSIEARLDPAEKLIEGDQQVLWRNQTEFSTDELWLHLYLNAFKNDRSTFAQELGRPFWQVKGPIPEGYWGWIEISELELEPAADSPANVILSSGLAHPEEGNLEDETVMRIRLERPIPPGGEARLRIKFRSRLPRGVARTGWAEDYFFAAQWFPKLGVFEEGRWNCPPYHAFTEYYADFGVYRVQLTVPADFTVGATGRSGRRNNPDGTVTYSFEAEQVHDFAWVASPRFQVRSARFVAGGLPNVSLRLLLLPEHEHLGDRYLRAVIEGLRTFGEWFGAYPYPELTIVDPAYNSDTDGMEYPRFITGRAYFWAPEDSLALESTTVHEVAHQWWYGIVANNEFEEAWLDEGWASWSESLAMRAAYPESVYVETFLGGIPLVFETLTIPYETINLPRVRRFGTLDRMTQPSRRTVSADSYRTNAYAKPEVVLWTLQRLIGEERMREVMSAYFQRFSYRHPRTQDFIQVVEEVSGEDLSNFFAQTFNSSDLIDYSIVHAGSEEVVVPPGGEEGESREDAGRGAPVYRSEVVVRREEGAHLPVEVLVVFEDGEEVLESWDGRQRWRRFVYRRSSRLQRAVVDPERKILLDIDPTNNSRVLGSGSRGMSRATGKWSSKWLFWLQNLLETFAFLG